MTEKQISKHEEIGHIPDVSITEEALVVADTGSQVAINLTNRNMTAAILALAVPAVTTLMMESVHHLVDAFWVGRLGTEPLAAVSGAMFLLWMVYSLVKMAAVGLNTVVARRTGAERHDLIPGVVANGIMLSMILASLIMLPLLLFIDPLVSSLGIEGDVFTLAREYIRVFLIFMPLIYLSNAVDATFKGSGDTKTPMFLFIVSVLINAALDPFLIFGWAFFPELGLRGAALATVIGKCIFLAGGALILLRRGTIQLNRDFWKPDPELMKRMLQIGAPLAATSIMFSMVYVFLTRIISDFGAVPLAALGLGHRIESVAYFICFGFHVAAATITGQYMGAGRPDLAEKAAWRTLWISFVPAVPVVLVFIFASEYLASFFTSDMGVIAECGRYLRIIGYFELFMFSESILQGAFSGAGNSLPPMLISVPLSIARVPAAWFLAHHVNLGPEGIWWAISLSTIIKGGLMAIWFRLGRWKNVEV